MANGNVRDMAHEAGIVLPGSFVVLQGIPGDGMSNTIDTLPTLGGDENQETDDQPDDFHYVPTEDEDGVVFCDSVPSEGQQPTLPLYNNPALLPTSQIPSLSVQPLATAAVTGATIPSVRGASEPDDPFVVVGADDSRERRKPSQTIHGRTLSRSEERSIRSWTTTCRTREVRQRKDWLPLQEKGTMFTQDEKTWWLKEGKVCVFSKLPFKSQGSVQCDVIGVLAPGLMVVATEMICVESTTLNRVNVNVNVNANASNAARTHPKARSGWVQFLKIESPLEGFVALSIDGYVLLGPGLPSLYTDPQVWLWRVTCSVGAFVREGLELTTRHVETLPHGSLLRVTRKTINSMGLSRLRVHSGLDKDDGPHVVEGWISEFLNPLSGQRGQIAQPIPFPVPALYRVSLSEGAVVRSGVELSSPQIGHAPAGAILSITGREFSEHPMDKCIERLRLAGNGGWVSVRLNRPPPNDELVLEMIKIDGSFNPEYPALFHLQAQSRVQEEQDDSSQQQAKNTAEELRQGELSSVEDDGKVSSESSEDTAKPTCRPVSRNNRPPKKNHDDRCLICLTEERNATIVHGETGHIACCLICARILYARGDRCPVCRLPIDSVIQQFWA